MAVAPGDVEIEAVAALVPVAELEARRLADDGDLRQGQIGPDIRDHPGRAEAAQFLVIAERDVDGALELACEHGRHQAQHEGDESLHIGGSAPVEAPIGFAQGERIARPGLARHRHHVRMAGEDDAAIPARAKAGIEIGLIARIVEHEDIRVIAQGDASSSADAAQPCRCIGDLVHRLFERQQLPLPYRAAKQ